MKTTPSPPPRNPTPREGFTEQDVCNYAHHLWLENGMSFDGDPWAEARACLAANLPPVPASQPERSHLLSHGTARAKVPAQARAVPHQPAPPRHENPTGRH
jgi:hypothetical protein